MVHNQMVPDRVPDRVVDPVYGTTAAGDFWTRSPARMYRRGGGAMARIQEQFGQRVIDSLAEFARQDIASVADLEANDFAFVHDADLRAAIARTMYGARWLYKLGLALLVSGDESIAHVRIQVVDYASVCEALTKYTVGHGIQRGCMKGQGWRTHRGRVLDWTTNFDKTLKERDFRWAISVAEEEGIISTTLAAGLQHLRGLRNTVHITELATTQTVYYRGLAKVALTRVTATTRSCKAWKLKHP